jgi:hypothetical protein
MTELQELYAAKQTVFAVGAARPASATLATLVDAPHIVSDVIIADILRVTLDTAGASRIFDRPANLYDGARLMLEIIQDATGGRAVVFSDPVWNFSASFPFPGLSAAPGKLDRLGFQYVAPRDQLDFIAFIPGF